jgi:adenylate cyclase
MHTVFAALRRQAAAACQFLRQGGKGMLFSVGVCLTLAVAALYLAQPSWLRFQDLKLYDILTAGNRPRTTSGLPVIVDIDDASLAEYGQWPWPRYRIGLLLARLQKAGVRAVGLDMLFAEPDRTAPSVFTAQLLHDLKVQATVTGLPEALRDYDRVLANVLRSGPFALGYFFEFGGARSGQPPCPLPHPGLTEQGGPGAKPLAQCLIRADSVACPLGTLLAAAQAAGFFNIEPDPDGILRRMPLLLAYGDGVYPGLALATVMEAYGVKNLLVRTTPGGVASLTLQSPSLGDRVMPLDAAGRLLVDYRGPGGAFPHVRAADILSGRPLPVDLSGKIVFVGTSAAALSDLRATPLDRAMSGVEIHATVADMLVTGDSLYRPDWIPAVELLCLLAAGLAAAALMAVARPLPLLVPFLGLGALAWFGAATLMRRGIYASPLCTLLVLGLVFIVLTFLKFWREEGQKRFIHQAFARYVSPTVVSRIVARRDALTLSGEEQECTILFSDVRGFTTLSENLSPSQVVELLQSYFTPMTRIITDHMGTLDKFIGDAIMAFWNAPVATPGHHGLAVRAALAMQAELARLNVDLVKTFGYPIRTGVGLHCGVVRVGNFGSRDLFNYTVIGDAVNLCSRLEGLTKFYGVPLLVSDSLCDAAGDDLVFQEIDRVRVKGKSEPVTIHTVRTREEHAAREAELNEADAARALYVAGDFSGAAAAYAALGARFDQRLYAVFAERAAHLAASPPGADWDGVFEHTSK